MAKVLRQEVNKPLKNIFQCFIKNHKNKTEKVFKTDLLRNLVVNNGKYI